MPIGESQNRCEKLFEHLNYCLSVLKKTMDQQRLQIFKRVQHDVEILQKYIKSIMKYNDKREKQIERLALELKTKDRQILIQNGKILELSQKIQKKQEEISLKQGIIEHLKYSKNIDISYVSSILISGNQSILQKKMGGQDSRKTRADQEDSDDGFDLQQCSQNCEYQEIQTRFPQKQTTLTSTKGQSETETEIETSSTKKQPLFSGTKKDQGQNLQNRKTRAFILNGQTHKASSLIFTD